MQVGIDGVIAKCAWLCVRFWMVACCWDELVVMVFGCLKACLKKKKKQSVHHACLPQAQVLRMENLWAFL